MSQAALDKFGELLMTRVRDEAISDWRMILDGSMKGERAQRIRKSVRQFSERDRSVVESLVPEIVDSVLHHLLYTFEQSSDVRIAVSTSTKEISSLTDVSDGLAGELYSEEGWISRFSKER
jgi:glutamyl-tRNA reductase